MNEFHPPQPSSAGDPLATERYRRTAERVLDARLEQAPEAATELGDHRFDARLTDWSAQGVRERVIVLHRALEALDELDDTVLCASDQVDLEVLRTAVARDLWSLEELREHEGNPLLHLPGDALYPLVARDCADPLARLAALVARLEAVPERLETARDVLQSMSRVHVETAIEQTRGVIAMLGSPLEPLLQAETGLRGAADDARAAAAHALTGYARWLEHRLPECEADPRLGDQHFEAKLWYTLDTETSADTLLTRAESDLLATEEEIAEVACRFTRSRLRPGLVREVLDELAARYPVAPGELRATCARELDALRARVVDLDLVTVPDDPVEVIEMPPARRGIAVAYCDPPGPLEPPLDGRPLPTLFAVSPPPPTWPQERVESFHREYNGHMLRDLVVHEAMPGHLVQLAHASRYQGSTRVRACTRSEPFVEGWAVYAEELVARHGLGRDPLDDLALQLVQLKMKLRMTINAILDLRVHARGMTEAEAMQLMTVRGHQEIGEAAGKWRRVLLTSAQLSTYYVGYREVGELVRQVRVQRPEAPLRDVHDLLLGQGAPPPRHLRRLLALETA